MTTYRLIQGDCLKEMDKLIEEGIVVDAIITDLPYGVLAGKWDSPIPFDKMWKRINKLIKPNGAIVLFGSEPFSSALRMSNIKNYKYDWIWDKIIPAGMLYARYQPMRQFENIIVFSKKKATYYPQKTLRKTQIKGGGMTRSDINRSDYFVPLKKEYKDKFPINILKFKKVRQGILHTAQKPVALIEYLIKTYTKEDELVLDFTMGSGTTGVACLRTNRRFIGIELDEKYFEIAKERIENERR